MDEVKAGNSIENSSEGSRDETGITLPAEAGKLAGQKINDRYLLVHLLGRGGWSEIYEGFDPELNRKVAVKILYSHLSWKPDSLRRFQAEAEAAANINHANVVSIYDYGFLPDGQPFIVMQLVAGKTLKDFLRKQGTPDWRQAIRIFLEVCQGLKAAHMAGLVHRDVKPSNILIANDEGQTVRLADFGLAKQLHGESGHSLTQTGETIGTPYYMSPEQCMGEAVDLRSDIYGLGCVMYETLSGELPFEGGSLFEILLNQVNLGPSSLLSKVDKQIPQDLEAVIFKCMSKLPADRYANTDELAADLNKILSGQPIERSKTRSKQELRQTKSVPKLPRPVGTNMLIAAAAISIAPVIAFTLVSGNLSTGVKTQALTAFKSKNGTVSPVRAPGLANLAPEQSLFLPFFNTGHLLFRRCLSKEKQSGFITYQYTGLLTNNGGTVAFSASETIDPEQDLSECSITYGGDMSARFALPGGKEQEINHIRAIDTIHQEDGFLMTSVKCFGSREFTFTTKENGEIVRVEEIAGNL